MTYVDGFVLAVPTANRQRFIDHARKGDSVFIELGAVRVLECWGDDVPDGKQTDFRRAVQATAEETVVFSWIEWPDKATRDGAMTRLEEVMKTDPRMSQEHNPMPFDGARLIYGGFSPIVTLEAPQVNRHGDFIWYELLTTDADAAQAFYAKVLPWTFADSGQAGMDYRIVRAPDAEVGGLMALTNDMIKGGARPVWLPYLAADDVDQAVAKLQEKGGFLQMPAMDVPMVGRIAMVGDPQGAPFYLMKPQAAGKSRAFAYDQPRVGHAAWNELHTTDQEAAWSFYGELVGWRRDGEMDMGPMGAYQFIRHTAMVGAIMRSDPSMGPPRWNTYFRVPDIDAAKTAVEAGGGQVVQGPDEIPGGDYSMNCVDPQGAAFGLVGARNG